MKARDTVPRCHCEFYYRVCSCNCDDCDRVRIMAIQAEATWKVAFDEGKREGIDSHK